MIIFSYWTACLCSYTFQGNAITLITVPTTALTLFGKTANTNRYSQLIYFIYYTTALIVQ